MNFNNFLSIIATLISVISLYLTHQNTSKQRALEKEMQQSEFNFSRKKVWYEKQNEILDTSLIKLMKNFSNLQYMSSYYTKINEAFEKEEEQTVIKLTKLIFEKGTLIYENNLYLNAHKHYFSKSIENKMGLVSDLTQQMVASMHDIGEDSFKDEEFKDYLKRIKIHISKITDEIRDEFLYF